MPCPKCGSNNISTNNKGYCIGKGVIGATILGPLGLIAGNIGRHDIICTCLDCGHTWHLKKQIQEREIEQAYKELSKEKPKKDDEVTHNGCLAAVVIAIIFFAIIGNSSDNSSDTSSSTSSHTESSPQQNYVKETESAVQEQIKQAFSGTLTATQIDKICKNSLAEVNANAVSNYVKVSSNSSARKYIYQSKETLYKYTCGFTGKDTFYINGEGWEDIIPRGTLYKGKTSNCVDFDLYDPGFKLTHNFTVCD